jgi:hypothetical protein
LHWYVFLTLSWLVRLLLKKDHWRKTMLRLLRKTLPEILHWIVALVAKATRSLCVVVIEGIMEDAME